MAEATKIQWCDSTFNPWTGCTKVGPGCDFCYAETMAKRTGLVKWGPGEDRRRTSVGYWRQPLKWAREADAFREKHGRRQRVFCASMADVFDNEVADEWRRDLFDLIRATPELDWLLLTKRIGNAAKMLPPDWGEGWPQVILMATVVNQDEAERDVPKLLRTPATRRGLSCEPLLGPTDLRHLFKWCPTHDFDSGFCVQDCGDWQRLDWAIIGGESGPKARSFELQWARSIVAQCRHADVSCFVKQLGSNPTLHGFTGMPIRDRKGGNPDEWPDDLRVRQYPERTE